MNPNDFSAPPPTSRLPMDPAMEAFFIAISLEMGPPPQTHSGGLPREWLRVLYFREVKKYMRDHPGAPTVIAKLRRMTKELSGGLRLEVDDDYFWEQMMDAYDGWYREQES